MEGFLHLFIHYLKEILPALVIGFLISGFVHELIPENIVLKYLGRGGIMPIVASTLIGTILPVCCWGSLPIAVSFYKKGARLGPILAFLVATPATSISAFLVAWSVLGPAFAVYIFFAVIVMGLGAGILGNLLSDKVHLDPSADCPKCKANCCDDTAHKKRSVAERTIAAFRYAFITLPKEIGLELVIGIMLAAIVGTFMPIGHMVKAYLGGWFGYAFSIVFGIFTYLCSTAHVPFTDSLIRQGMSPGAGMTLLLIGPITSYGTMLVLRKEYGARVLISFLIYLIIISLLLGIGFGFLPCLSLTKN